MRKKTIILFLTMGALMLSGCNTKIGNTTQQTTESSTTTSSSATETDTSDMFSDRDKEVGYDESESVTISLADRRSANHRRVCATGIRGTGNTDTCICRWKFGKLTRDCPITSEEKSGCANRD